MLQGLSLSKGEYSVSELKHLMILLKSIAAKDYDDCFKQGSLFDSLSTENWVKTFHYCTDLWYNRSILQFFGFLICQQSLQNENFKTYFIKQAESPTFAHCANKFSLLSAQTRSTVAAQPCRKLIIVICKMIILSFCNTKIVQK